MSAALRRRYSELAGIRHERGRAVAGVTFNGTTDNAAANVHVGDSIRFGYQGRTYLLLGGSTSIVGLTAGSALPITGGNPTSYLWATDNSNAVSAPTPNGVTYQELRQPTKSSVPGLQLPEGVVIDLIQSGFGLPVASSPNYLTVDGNPIVVTFSPSGTVDQVYYYGQFQGHMASPLCLLIGKPDQVANSPGSDANALDGTLGWVAVTPQGRVITAENFVNSAASTNVAGNRAFIYGSYGATTSLGGG